MRKNPAKVLIVDDDKEFALVVGTLLETEGFASLHTEIGSEANQLCRKEDVDVVLLDLHLGAESGIDLLKGMKDEYPELPVIVVTGHGSVETAAAAIRERAFDYLGKPFENQELISQIRRAVEFRRRRITVPSENDSEPRLQTTIVGRCPAMVSVYRLVARVAPTDSTVLITGESGTGKELVARAIHDNSPRRQKPFLPVNCGAFTDTLLESELFGHVRGAFTGAATSHRGIFETANGGTVFLDEISETSPALQVKLLRVLQEQEIRPVGASEPRRVDVRIVAATNRPPATLRSSSDFRSDLLYRLSVINIELPPLRERKDDIPLLVDHFLKRITTRFNRQVRVSSDAISWLRRHSWPGNVRELENAVERAVTLNVTGTLVSEDFSALSDDQPAASETGSVTTGSRGWHCPVPSSLDEVERQHIIATLRFTEGNKLRAAELLGIGRYSLYRKAERLGIDLDSVTEN